MPGRWLTNVLESVLKDLAIARKVAFTLKALRELAELGLDEEDACDVLASLTIEDCAGRKRSGDDRRVDVCFQARRRRKRALRQGDSPEQLRPDFASRRRGRAS